MKHTLNSLLIADDNEMNRDMLSRRLEAQGYLVATANDGQQALDMMAVEDYDLLLLDIMMPIMDGYGVLEQMRQSPKMKNIPVIVLTAENEAKSVIRCIELGANDYLVKPFDMVALRNRIVRSLLNKRVREDVDGDLNWTSEPPPEVLIVEDDEMSRDLLVRRVTRAGYHVQVAVNGQDAMDKLGHEQYDLVLLDIMMPQVSGFEVLEHIKSNDELKNITVMMLSALDDQENIEKCLRMGAEDYITKPFNSLILKSRILSCMQSKRIQDQDRERDEQLKSLSEEGEKFRT